MRPACGPWAMLPLCVGLIGLYFPLSLIVALPCGHRISPFYTHFSFLHSACDSSWPSGGSPGSCEPCIYSKCYLKLLPSHSSDHYTNIIPPNLHPPRTLTLCYMRNSERQFLKSGDTPKSVRIPNSISTPHLAFRPNPKSKICRSPNPRIPKSADPQIRGSPNPRIQFFFFSDF